MSKPMDNQAQALVMMYKHHLTYNYSNKVNADREYKKHVTEFQYYKALPITNFSQSVWDEMNDLFTGDEK
jgi:hypothetical protein|tara:strand:+ start:513 stop:722 length:210 start_codon:yes stop_codon:yes gene_type:complete